MHFQQAHFSPNNKQWVTFQVILRCVFGFLDGPVAERLTTLMLRWMDASLSTPVAVLGMAVGPGRVRQALADAATTLEPGATPWLPHRRIAALRVEIVEILRGEVRAVRGAPAEARAGAAGGDRGPSEQGVVDREFPMFTDQ